MYLCGYIPPTVEKLTTGRHSGLIIIADRPSDLCGAEGGGAATPGCCPHPFFFRAVSRMLKAMPTARYSLKSLLVNLTGICLVPLSSPALASYTDGFFGLIVLFYSVPVMVIGLIISTVFIAFSAFKKPRVFKAYVAFWVMGALAATLVTSAMSMEGGDRFSPILIFIGFSIIVLIILSPAIVSYRLNKRDELDEESADE